MRTLIILLAFMAFALVSCGTKENPTDDAQKSDTIIDNSSPLGDTGPLFCIVHPSKVSEELRSFVGIGPDNFLGQPVTKDEMCIYWCLRYVGDSPYDDRWWRKDQQYVALRENLDKIESESPSYVTFLSLAVYAGTKDIVITADKKLFGREAGENLSDKFKIVDFDETEVLLSYPDGRALKRYEEDKTMTVAEWGGMSSMLYDIEIKFNELPSEVYEEVTFDIRIETTETLTLNGSVTVIFKN